jgi:hypothetical protein
MSREAYTAISGKQYREESDKLRGSINARGNKGQGCSHRDGVY